MGWISGRLSHLLHVLDRILDAPLDNGPGAVARRRGDGVPASLRGFSVESPAAERRYSVLVFGTTRSARRISRLQRRNRRIGTVPRPILRIFKGPQVPGRRQTGAAVYCGPGDSKAALVRF